MNDISHRLHKLNLAVSVPLKLPELDDIVLVEEQLMMGLPADFRAFLMSVGDVVYGAIEPVTVTDAYAHNYLPEVAALAWDRGIPRDLIPICVMGENYYCIADDGEISYWENFQQSHQQSDQHWNDIWAWAEAVWLEPQAPGGSS